MKHPKGATKIEVLVNDEPLAAKFSKALIEVEIRDDLDAPGACVLTFWAWDEASGNFRVDDAIFDVGNSVAVQFGHDDKLETILRGEIVALDFDANRGRAAQFSVRAYDRSHRLRRGTQRRTFANMKESDIASQIADKNGFSAKVEDSGEALDYVLQDNLSDYEFLQRRAAKIDYEVVVDGKDLIFRPREGQKTVMLDAAKDVVEFSAQLKAMDQVGTVEVHGWDSEKKEMFKGTSANAKAAPKDTDGETPFGKAKLVVVNQEVRKQAEADQIAEAEFERRARRSMGIEGRCWGRTDLRAGVVVDLQGAGKRFSGKYRLISVTHQYAPRYEFWTSFSAERELT